MVAQLVTLLSDVFQVVIVLCSRHYCTSQSNDAISVLTISKKSVYTMKDDEYWSEGIKTEK